MCEIKFSIHNQLRKYCSQYCKVDNFVIEPNPAHTDIKIKEKIQLFCHKNSDKVKILLVGRNVKIKNFNLVANAFKDLENVILVHFGDIEPLGIIDGIVHFGYIPNNETFLSMRLFDYVCVPSLIEAAPTVTLEAQYNKTPLMVSDIEAHRNISKKYKFDPMCKKSLLETYLNLENLNHKTKISEYNLIKTKNEVSIEFLNWIKKST